jgi:hypothetical protein
LPRYDTSFPFGANVKAGGSKKPKAPKRKKARGGRTTSSKSRKFWAGMHGS